MGSIPAHYPYLQFGSILWLNLIIMSNRTYNILFHLHTVSGIVISAVLFIIFFSGSFAFFRDEIANWERNKNVVQTNNITLNLNTVIDSISNHYNLYSRDIAFSKHHDENLVRIDLSAAKDTLTNPNTKSEYFYLNPETYTSDTYEATYTLGEFLYRLHFLAQIPYPAGYYLSGFTAFFFLFALITGLLVHWKKIVSNFYTFRPLAKAKTLWTDAHTALGVIGFPFQFVFALTGVFFMINAILVAPAVFTLYNGDTDALYEDLGYAEPHYDLKNEPIEVSTNFTQLVEQTRERWDHYNVNHLHIFNYGDAGMRISIEGFKDHTKKFTALGTVVYNADGEVLEAKDPEQKASYLDGVKNVLFRLHYGDFGGYFLKMIYFILGLVSCFVIISGVMIWLVARDKRNVPEKKRRFNEKVVRIYLAICLSMLPVTALNFIIIKIWPLKGMEFIYNIYFLSWVVFTAFLLLKKNHHFINRFCLLTGGILAFIIPVVNGFMSGNWLWISYHQNLIQILVVDLIWLLIGIAAMYAYSRVLRKTA